MGKTNGALPPHQDPYFVPQNGDFMIARLVIVIALQGRLLVTRFFASKKKKYVRIIQCCVTAVRNWLNTKYLINIDQDGLPHLWLGSTNTIKIQKSMHFEFVPTTAFFVCSKLANWILVRFEKSIKGPKRVYFHFSYFLSGSTFWSSKMGWANSRDFNSFFQPTIWAMSNESPSWNDREDRTGCRVD